MEKMSNFTGSIFFIHVLCYSTYIQIQLKNSVLNIV